MLHSEKKVVLLRAIDMLPDPRVEKYVSFYKSKGIAYSLVGWNRAIKEQFKENTTYFHKPAPFGSGDANAVSLLKFNKFIFSYLKKSRRDYTTIHACDLDTVMPALLVKVLYGKKVIFDVFDWYSHSRNIASGLLRRVIKICEYMAVKMSDRVIICDNERRRQIPFKVNDCKLIVLPNIPNYEKNSPPEPRIREDDYDLYLSYVGILSTFRGLEDLLEVVSAMPNISFTIGGFGELQDMVECYANKYQNINFVGKLNYNDSLQTMADSDLICAMYYTDVPNHVYAAPNKFYEGLYLGVPILTTIGTIPGTKCEKGKIGFAIPEGQEAIRTFFHTVGRESLKERGKNARRVWDEKYKTIWSTTIETEYFDSI